MAEIHEQHANAATPDTRQVIKREDLMRGAREVFIEHDGALYLLSVTKANKLILNKTIPSWMSASKPLADACGRPYTATGS